MTRLCSEKTSLILLGFLAFAAAGCPRTDFDFGGDGSAGKDAGGAGSAGSDEAPGSGAAGSMSSGESCGSRGLPACGDDEFCSFPSSASCGETDKPGVCKPKTKGDVICTLEYAPVCGCDGKTYGNACGAAAANTSVRKTGECEDAAPGARSCGGLIGKGCPDNQYCDYPPDAICGAADATGTCMTKPRACTRIYKPVCGCDDKTYGNDCEAHAAGVSIASEGECKPSGGEGKSCGGLIGEPCADGQYCDYEPDALCGAADATGTCTPKPEVCEDIYKPVCGCDGKKYGNACEAAAAGMAIVSEGECKPSGGDGKSCGGLLGQSCAAGQYCDYPPDAICGAADATGVCKVKPTACTFEYAPVCGCDGETYPTACAAASSGVSVASKGECEAPGGGENCGGIAGLQCEAKNQYCNFPIATRCGSGDQFGQCADKPTGCTKELHEVCGCDGNTYGNPCMAAAAGVSIQKDGACAKVGGSGQTCGGLIGAQCPSGEYCDYPESAQCGAADQTGTCKTIPEVCTADYTPVCGCDDKTYGNACGAHAKSVSVLHAGPC